LLAGGKHTFNRQAVLDAREKSHPRRIELRVTTPQQAVRFVRDVGFCFLFPSPGIELPSLWDAVAGRVVKPLSNHSGYEIERTWGWKDALLGKKQWYYGKLIRGKATLVGLDFLPNFYALSSNYGDCKLPHRRAVRLSPAIPEVEADLSVGRGELGRSQGWVLIHPGPIE
jgi:hypothetical protein